VDLIAAGLLVGALTALAVRKIERRKAPRLPDDTENTEASREHWKMPPLDQLPPGRLSLSSRVWMTVLRSYLVVAGGLFFFKLIHLALSGGAS
jgi:hypothetical protein